MQSVNIFETEFEFDGSDPAGYRGGAVRLSRALGARELGVNVFELPPGESLCPYHYEYVEEWLLMLEGELLLRIVEGEQQLRRGDVVAFPSGPDGAHKVTNRGSGAARFVMFSSAREPAVAVYPDSDKLGLWSGGDEADNLMVRRSEGHLDYWDGEV